MEFLLGLGLIGYLLSVIYVILPIGGIIGGIIFIACSIMFIVEGDGCLAILLIPLGILFLVIGIIITSDIIHMFA